MIHLYSILFWLSVLDELVHDQLAQLALSWQEYTEEQNHRDWDATDPFEDTSPIVVSSKLS